MGFSGFEFGVASSVKRSKPQRMIAGLRAFVPSWEQKELGLVTPGKVRTARVKLALNRNRKFLNTGPTAK